MVSLMCWDISSTTLCSPNGYFVNDQVSSSIKLSRMCNLNLHSNRTGGLDSFISFKTTPSRALRDFEVANVCLVWSMTDERADAGSRVSISPKVSLRAEMRRHRRSHNRDTCSRTSIPKDITLRDESNILNRCSVHFSLLWPTRKVANLPATSIKMQAKMLM